MPSRSRRSLWKNIWNRPPEWSLVPSEPTAPSAESRDATWIVASRPAMGTVFELRLPAYTLRAVALAEACFDLIDKLELQMTIYREDSELAVLNRRYHEAPVQVESQLFELLQLARSIHHATEGAYDIATGTLSRVWGFVQGPRREPSPDELRGALARTGLRHVIFDDENRTIMADAEGVELNLGSIGKGYAIDRVVRLLRNHPWPVQAMVHGGRSSLYALGHQPGTLFEPWCVALHNPMDPACPLVELKIVDQAIGTSGGTFQSFDSGGRTFGHIIDPRTGIPPAGPLSVTVVAPTAAEADAISTALYLTGPQAVPRLFGSRTDIAALFLRLDPDSSVPKPQLLAVNFPPERLSAQDLEVAFVPATLAPPESWRSRGDASGPDSS